MLRTEYVYYLTRSPCQQPDHGREEKQEAWSRKLGLFLELCLSTKKLPMQEDIHEKPALDGLHLERALFMLHHLRTRDLKLASLQRQRKSAFYL